MSSATSPSTLLTAGALSTLPDDVKSKPGPPSDVSSVLSSIPATDASSELSSPDEDVNEEEIRSSRPRKRVRPLPTPPSTSSSEEPHQHQRDAQDNSRNFKAKDYLEAGLYSITYKLASSQDTQQRRSTGGGRKKRKAAEEAATALGRSSSASSSSSTSFFPLPLYAGLEALEEKREFQLSFDIRRDFDPDFPGPDGAGRVGARRREYEIKAGKGRKPPPYKKIAHSSVTPGISLFASITD
jgi:hypothetical protein